MNRKARMEQMDNIGLGGGVSGFHGDVEGQGCVVGLCGSTIDFQYSHMTCMNFFGFFL